ncbi:hypothetical protein CYLTODRAFT_419492 [Cylindrobasidium torrendii FP15055 ss-10]|uniref:F-box domain-containing protein n=1 Tax=Cylindrobasidium torrendii FP15055 ss-10 TaxID=1314674 RepID=A0A0D7BJN3_9AGAR|nr:hypothetical protein CYLTODRAFT_419492 [Cylindrobasidium torrendii FP15055 ss-10]
MGPFKLPKLGHDKSDEHEPSPSILLNLPNEILDLIVAEFDEPDIISVGRLCRRLNQVAFGHHFFKPRPRPPNPPEYFLYDPTAFYIGAYRHTQWTFDTLDAVRMALFTKPKMHCINTRFSQAFPGEVQKVANFFDTKPVLHSVFLELPYGPGPAGLTRNWKKKRDEVLPEDLVKHRKSTYRLLNSLTQIRGDPVHLGNELMIDINQGVLLDDEATEPDFPPYDGPLLTTVTMITFTYSSFLFQTPFRQWTLDSLNACRLRRLVLEDVDIGPHLERLSLIHLEEVILRSRSVTQVQFNRFLSRHPTLLDVIIFRIASVDPHSAAAREAKAAIEYGALPKTRELTMHGDYLNHWLNTPGTLAALVSCRVEGSPAPTTLQDILHSFSGRNTIHSVHLPLCAMSNTQDWSLFPKSTRAEPKLKSITRIDIGLPMGWTMTPDRLDGIVASVALFPEVKSVSVWPATKHQEWGERFRTMLKANCPKLLWTIFDFEQYACDALSGLAEDHSEGVLV